MTTITINAETIVKLEAAGFSRWTKGNMDRLYINVTKLGLEVSYYNSGNVSSAKWCGEPISNADGRRLLSSKVWIDVKTGELHVRTDFHRSYDEDMLLENVAAAYVESIVAEPEQEEAETIQLDADNTINGNFVNAPQVSGKSIDVPTDERITVELDGQAYERTVYERLRWRNSGKSTVRARFVIIDGTNYLV